MAQAAQLRAHFATKALVPTAIWLDSFFASQKSSTPVAALKQTAMFRLLSSDFTVSLDQTSTLTLPIDIHNAAFAQRTLEGSIPVQLISREDIGCSCWSQIEAIEAHERGETNKGREIIRAVPSEENAPSLAAPGRGPHKLLLQDIKGTQVYAFDMFGIDFSVKMGAKLVLNNVQVTRALVLLEPATVVVLGGKIDAIHEAWHQQMKARLRAAIDRSHV